MLHAQNLQNLCWASTMSDAGRFKAQDVVQGRVCGAAERLDTRGGQEFTYGEGGAAACANELLS